jgi:flagellar protein FliO/FliZ
MQFMSAFGENRTLAFILAAVCLLIGVALVFVLFRVVFGRGIKLPGGRTRQQRLGVVDAFEIDRQRQLVIVRRDNIEHLIMIGGPNDVVIESAIIRAEAREGRESRPPRERDQPAISGLSWPAGPAATEVATQPPPETAPPARSPIPEPPPPPGAVTPPPRSQPPAPAPAMHPLPGGAPPAAGQSATEEPVAVEAAGAPAPPPAPPRPVRPPPLRPIAAGERPALPPRPPLSTLKREPRPLPPFLANRAKPAEQATPPTAAAAAAPAEAAPGPAEPAPESTPAAPPPPVPPPPSPEAAAPQPAADGQPSSAPKIELDPLESLEEEMAKLLGRNPNQS